MTTSPPQANYDVSTTTTDGPVMSFMNKRLRALKKKYNKILQIEEASSQGKPINKDQEEVLKTKPSILTLIDEYEKLRQPLYTVVQEEVFLNNKPKEEKQDDDVVEKKVEDLLKLLYFSCLFDVKQQSDFTSTMLTRTHERGCCLTYDYVTDDDGLLLGEKDLDIISLLGGLVVSRPVNSILSHKNALRSCVEHAKLWLDNSDKAIDDAGEITYRGLRERLEKILASDYFTTSPEMKAAVEVAAAAGKYAPSNVAVQGSSVSSEVTVQSESDFAQYEQKDEETENFEGEEAGAEQSIPVEELSKDESDMVNAVENISDHKPEVDGEGQNMETKDHQYGQRRDYHNQRGGYRGGGGGRRGYPNGRGGGRGSRGGGYQNGRNQHYDQPGGYYPKNYYNTRGRGGRGPRGNAFNNHGSAQGGHAPADEGGS